MDATYDLSHNGNWPWVLARLCQRYRRGRCRYYQGHLLQSEGPNDVGCYPKNSRATVFLGLWTLIFWRCVFTEIIFSAPNLLH